jgi:C4-dicarboxylate transporter DctQ subunit
MTWVGPLVRLLDALTKGLFALACIALVTMWAGYMAEVVLRYLFNAPTRWSSDAVSYALAACVALSLPAVTRDGAHVAITSLIDRLPQGLQGRCQRLLAVVSALVCLSAGVLIAVQAGAQWRDGIETVAALPIPKWWLSGLVVLGLGGAAAQFLRLAARPAGRSLGGEGEI